VTIQYPEFIIGRQEWVVLPELSIPAICAKVDTGAKTSSLHAYDIEYITKEGKSCVRFTVHPIEHNNAIICSCTSPLIDKRNIKSSNGEIEERPVIKTQLCIGQSQWDIELNLTNRDYMGHRMLIGREALGKHTLVYPGAAYIHGKITDILLEEKYKRTP
jgi:ribosomal protein S6--L-glutamate ligase